MGQWNPPLAIAKHPPVAMQFSAQVGSAIMRQPGCGAQESHKTVHELSIKIWDLEGNSLNL